MRAATRTSILEKTAPHLLRPEENAPDVITAPDKATARRLMVERFGSQCAAWLIKEHRVHLHRRGVLDFHIPKHRIKEFPMWFSFAVDYLGSREPDYAPNFEVLRAETDKLVVWRIKWRAWKAYREIVERMRSPS